MQTIDSLAEKLSSYLPPDQVSLVRRAYFFAEQAHDGQHRRSGEPYVTHPLAVADILSSLKMDHQSLMAAMLHDVIEDTQVTKEALSTQFGPEVGELVDGVSKLTHLEFETKKEEQAENFQKMALAMAKDIRVILVKLGDRLHNMRTLGHMPAVKKRRIARETLDIYAPIALRLGLNDLRVELEDLCFRFIFPMRSTRIENAVKKISGNRREVVSKIQQALSDHLAHESLPGKVIGREKHLLSIYEKMRVQGKSFSELMDVYAFRIITDKVDTCYRILGAVHNFYKPIPGRFKDYIAIPKANGYQSLHTTLLGLNGVPIEIQIRTDDMEAMANNGIAAHWLYKSGEENTFNLSQSRARAWVKGLLEMQHQAGNPLEFIENVKIDLFPDEVYVFTPKGKIMELPKGATAVDFAYAVHTDIGNCCVGCLVNKKIAPLSQPLESGDSIKIITASNAHPDASWLNFVVTGKARSSIRHYLKHQRRSESINLGQQLLSKALMAINMSIDKLDPDNLQQVLQESNLNTFEDLLEDIGLGNRLAFLIARKLSTEAKMKLSNVDLSDSMMITGKEGMALRYAKCCRPIPGDPIIGLITAGKGMVVHIESCNNIAEARNDYDRIVPMRWDKEMHSEFIVELRVELKNQRGVIAHLATAVASTDASIEAINIIEKDVSTGQVNISVGVTGRIHLSKVMRRIRVLRDVIKVQRIKN
ncbi:RelA/SpoT family protein [Gynuella sp.]|uniref:RelA/SpoT family protein n=1 Tax=Gynuella sp. TaxID=2969146 RepID=UPI003D12521D